MKVLWFLSGGALLYDAHRIAFQAYQPPSWMVALAYVSVGIGMVAKSLPGDD